MQDDQEHPAQHKYQIEIELVSHDGTMFNERMN